MRRLNDGSTKQPGPSTDKKSKLLQHDTPQGVFIPNSGTSELPFEINVLT